MWLCDRPKTPKSRSRLAAGPVKQCQNSAVLPSFLSISIRNISCDNPSATTACNLVPSLAHQKAQNPQVSQMDVEWCAKKVLRTFLFLSLPWPVFFLSCFYFYEFPGLCGCEPSRWPGQFWIQNQLHTVQFSGEKKGEKIKEKQLGKSPLLMDISNFPVGRFKLGCYLNTMLGEGY